MKIRCRGALCAAALAIFLSGCSPLWEREVYEREPHLTQEDSGALTANSYDSLKSVIIGVIRSGLSEADIRVTDYPGELTSLSLSALLNEIQTREPIGAYAVEYMAYASARVLSQYTVSLTIVYKRDTLPVISPVSGGRELEQAVRSALRAYRPLLTVEMPYYYAQDHDVERMVRAYYYSDPAWAMEYPAAAAALYPPSGESLRRIVELELTYKNPPGELRRKTRDTEARAERLLQSLPVFSPDGDEERLARTVLWLRDALCSEVRYDNDTAMLAAATEERQGGDPYTAYGALVSGLAVSEGHAMAFKLLCDKLEIDCLVVTGLWGGFDHAWNLVRIGDIWYHLDAALDNRGPVPTYNFFLFDDETAILETFVPDKSAYPAALPGPWSYEALTAPEESG
ncbi:MAG: hypothetical protein LBH95_05640 [Oscillospiraceae bacterium]|jgi:hypothetical protein|nr:hypothetical protein [Oscillospiraceae bacterium]